METSQNGTDLKMIKATPPSWFREKRDLPALLEPNLKCKFKVLTPNVKGQLPDLDILVSDA